eukprot:COSAG03_NODE_5_length_26473_cov_42.749526_9_plen_104_part_00
MRMSATDPPRMTGDSPVTADACRRAATAPAGVLAKMMVDKVVYTKRQPNTGQGGATGHARIVFSCSNRTQFKPTSPRSSDVVGARRTGVGKVVLRIPATSAAS